MVTGGDNGSVWFWDWNSGHCFQQNETVVQPGSLEAEAGIYAASFDKSGGWGRDWHLQLVYTGRRMPACGPECLPAWRLT